MFLHFFQLLNDLDVSRAINQSVCSLPLSRRFTWLCWLSLPGRSLIVDLRLMGRALTERPVAEVAKDAQPWMVADLLR